MKREWSDEELARALGAVRAEATDAPLALALERLRAERLPAWCAWTTRPWALPAACLLLVVSLAGGTWLGATGRLASGTGAESVVSSATAADTDPVASLLGDDATSGLVTGEGASTVVDSGAMR